MKHSDTLNSNLLVPDLHKELEKMVYYALEYNDMFALENNDQGEGMCVGTCH